MATITVTNTKDSGTGSLRDAIALAEDGDTISFAPDLAGQTIRLNEQLVVDKSLTIDGDAAPGLTLSGENKTRILHISYDYSDVVLRNLTFANGNAVDNDPNTTLQGGAIEVRDPNTLEVENSRFINNKGERGGAIFMSYGSKATIKDSVFDGNDGSSANDGFSAGAISTYGGGEGATVVNSNGDRNVGGDALLDISGTTFTNNKGTYGAVYTLLTNLEVEDSTFKGNVGNNGSGAIFTDGANGTEKPDNLGGTTVIRNVVAEDNVGNGDYGGAFFLWGYSKDTYIIEDTQIINNTARRGGGLAVMSGRDEGAGNGTQLIIRNSIIEGNTAPSQGGGLWTDVKGGVTIDNSTFADNSVTNENGGIGGAVVLNTGKTVKNTIENTTFVDNSASDGAGSIWIAGKENAQNLTISDSQFANNRSRGKAIENTVNFEATDGGGNLVQNTNGVDTGLPTATEVENLPLNPTEPATPSDPKPAPEAELEPIPGPKPKSDSAPEAEPEPMPEPMPPANDGNDLPQPDSPDNPSGKPDGDNGVTRPKSFPGLVASFSFDEKTGKIATDSSQNGRQNNGRLRGHTTFTEQGTVAFDGKGDSLRLANSRDINLGEHAERTIALSFQAADLSKAGKKQVLYEEGGKFRGLNIYLQGDTLYAGGWNNPDQESNWEGTWLKVGGIEAGEWNDVALVLEGSETVTEDALTLYLNGEKVDTGEGSQLWKHPGNISLGSTKSTRFADGYITPRGMPHGSGARHSFAGEIDDVMIYNNALDGSQIQMLADTAI
ncbi:MAG: LamG-like jellyroll fold domain-containing protein [Cyanobacteria bacterium P01_F01_bin.86]